MPRRPRRLAARCARRLVERGSLELYERDRAAADGGARPRWRTPASGSTPTGWARSRPGSRDRVEELEARATEPRGRGVHARLDPAGGADPVREARARPRGERERPATRPTAASSAASATQHEIVPRDRGMARVLEAAQHLPPAAAVADLGARRAAAHDVQPGGRRHRAPVDDESEPPVDPDPHRARRARSARRSSPRKGTGCSPPTTARSSCASSRTSRGSRCCARPSSGARTSTRATAAEVLGKEPATLTRSERDVAKMVNFGIIYGISSFGLSENLEIPQEEAQAVHRHLPRPLPARAGVHRADDRPGRRGRLRDDAARPAAADPGAPRVEPADAVARRAPRRQHGDAGHRGRHDQGRDDPRPTTGSAPRAGRSRLVLQVHDELLLEVPGHRGRAPSRSSSGRRWSAPTRSTRRSRSRSASATTGPTRSSGWARPTSDRRPRRAGIRYTSRAASP